MEGEEQEKERMEETPRHVSRYDGWACTRQPAESDTFLQVLTAFGGA